MDQQNDNAKKRCAWCLGHPLYIKYHDEEWGVPEHADQKLFEMLILEGAQAGLNWLTILKKREGYRLAYDGFDYNKIAAYDEAKCEALRNDERIVRNRLKIKASVTNAQAFLRIRKEFGSFDSYLWGFVDGQPIVNSYKELAQLPAYTDLSDRISKDLKKRGLSFVGSTIIYAFMQAVGVVDDHVQDCWRKR